jgi:hypothetical protein
MTCRRTIFWLLASCSLGLLFNREDGGSTFLRNVGELLRTKERTFQKTGLFCFSYSDIIYFFSLCLSNLSTMNSYFQSLQLLWLQFEGKNTYSLCLYYIFTSLMYCLSLPRVSKFILSTPNHQDDINLCGVRIFLIIRE